MLGGYAVDKEYPGWHLYLRRRKKPKGKKTNIYEIWKHTEGVTGDEQLGLIKWHGAFRQYWFEPRDGTGWSKGCLDIISKFLKDKNDRHRNKLRREKNERKS